MPDFTEEVKEPSIEHIFHHGDVFTLINEFILEGPLQDYALSPDRTLVVCNVAKYDPVQDAFTPSIRVLNLTDFQETASDAVLGDVEFVAISNSARVLTTSPKSVKKMMREWHIQTADSRAKEMSALFFPGSIAEGSPRVKGLTSHKDGTSHLLVQFFNSTNHKEGILAYSAQSLNDTWFES